MDGYGNEWYFSGMVLQSQIPVFNLFGETGAFPDVIHCERIWDRARLHDWVIAPHRHREMVQVFLMHQGQARVRVDGTDRQLDDGMVLFVPVRAVHGFSFRMGAEGLVLSIPLTIVSAIVTGSDELAARLARPFIGRADPRVLALAGEIATAFRGSGPFRAVLLAGLAQSLLAALAEIAAQEAAEVSPLVHRRLLDLDRLLARHLPDGWGVAEYAAALAVTPGHLTRICQTATGQSAARYIEMAVMTEASRLLAFTRLPVAEIGFRLGFRDPPYFSRRYRARTGEPPSAYRARFVD